MAFCTFEFGSESLYHILINLLKFIDLVINKHLVGDEEDFGVVRVAQKRFPQRIKHKHAAEDMLMLSKKLRNSLNRYFIAHIG